MAPNYLNMLENLFERWQSRRKTLNISPAEIRSQSQECPQRTETNSSSRPSIEPNKPSPDGNKENAKPRCSSDKEETEELSVYKQIGDANDSQLTNTHYQSLFEVRMSNSTRTTLANCPSLLFVSIALVCLISLNLSCFDSHQTLPDLYASPLHGWRQFGRDMIGRLAAREPTRWAFISEPSNSIRDIHKRRRPENFITRAVNRLSNRIGSRNTIRVHNAFRDLAWRLLSGFSMPTPVIYELRRQHLYSTEDDLMNDSLHNKNTSRTIRSRRLLWPLIKLEKTTRSGDDDEENTNRIRRRLQLRLEDLINLSRRSLFGRVVRLPTLFPFKRQESSDEASSTGKSSRKKTNNGRRRRLLGRRKKKEADRQMISIDGKQYYIDDDGSLKELNDKNENES